MGIKTIQPTSEHEALRVAIITAMQAHGTVPTIEAFCVMAQLIGQLIATHTKGRHSPDEIFNLVLLNAKSGHASALQQMALNNPQGNA